MCKKNIHNNNNNSSSFRSIYTFLGELSKLFDVNTDVRQENRLSPKLLKWVY